MLTKTQTQCSDFFLNQSFLPTSKKLTAYSKSSNCPTYVKSVD